MANQVKLNMEEYNWNVIQGLERQDLSFVGRGVQRVICDASALQWSMKDEGSVQIDHRSDVQDRQFSSVSVFYFMGRSAMWKV